MKQILTLALVSTFGLVLSLPSQVSAEAIPEIDCLIEPNTVVNLSSPVSGVIDIIKVDRSDVVTKNEIVATLKSELEQLNVKTSKENLNLSKKEHQRATELYREKAITLSEKEKADHEKTLYELELKNSIATLALRQIRSPIDGVVVDRYKMPGEYVEDKPILKIAQLDPLRVEVVSTVENFGKIKKGMHAKIIPEYGDFDDLVAEIVVVDQVIDAASGTFGIRLELKNEGNKVPGGLKCKVRFFSQAEEDLYTNKTSAKKAPIKPVALSSPPDIQLPVKSVIKPTKKSIKPAVVESPAVKTPVKPVVTTKAKPVATTMASAKTPARQLSLSTVDACSSIGVFKDRAELRQLISALGDNVIASDIREQLIDEKTYLVNTITPENLQQARLRVASIRDLGVTDTAIIPRPNDEYVIALGLYSNRTTAEKQQAKLQKLGVDSSITPRVNRKIVFWADMATTLTGSELLLHMEKGTKKSRQTLVYQTCERKDLDL